MKKLILIISIVLSQLTIAQNNGNGNNSTITETNSGNIGIGTLTPSAKLDVNGTLIVDEDARFKQDIKTNGNARVEGDIKGDQKLTVDGTATFNSDVKMPNIGNPNNGILTSQNYEILIKLPNGNVKSMGLGELVNMAYQTIACQGGDISNPVWSHATNKIFSACQQVNVGIATASPQYSLDVNGIAHFLKSKVGVSNALENALINGFTQSNSNDLIQLGVHNVSTGGQSEVRFKITNDGTVFVKELRVRQVQNFPDYVFKANYKLMSLYELEKYIKQYNHLPNMPTAKEVARDGANVGEIQRVLVEKVEELTLYNIALKNELELLKKEVADIKALITK